MNDKIKKMLPKVRFFVLNEIAHGFSPFGLSWLTWKLGPRQHNERSNKFTSSGLKSVRGHAQACLAILAREGILYGRNKPEDVVYHHYGEVDKRFHARITKQEALKRLERMK